MPTLDRRTVLAAASAAALTTLARPVRAQERRFDPQPGAWRSFEFTTRVELRGAAEGARVWVPLPSVEGPWQRVGDSAWTGNAGQVRIATDAQDGARMLLAEFSPGTAQPVLEVTSRLQTQNRATDWSRKTPVREDAATLRYWTAPTDLLPTDGIVRETAEQATQGARSDFEKVQALYDWVVENTYREPKVRGCGTGDIRALLESGNFGGKCADLNALFVGLCRAVGVPARDVYGIRLAPSAFGYRELGANPASLKGAQHCRAEVFLKDHGWTAMDPADVAKVMRQETPAWIKDSRNPLIVPVKKALFGGWEGNWLAYNSAHDVALPGSTGPRVGFLMYPQAETAAGRADSLAPDDFRYTMSARETTAAA